MCRRRGRRGQAGEDSSVDFFVTDKREAAQNTTTANGQKHKCCLPAHNCYYTRVLTNVSSHHKTQLMGNPILSTIGHTAAEQSSFAAVKPGRQVHLCFVCKDETTRVVFHETISYSS